MVGEAERLKTDVAVRILPDGRVVFGDLTPELREVARALAPGSFSEEDVEGAPSSAEPVAPQAPGDHASGGEP